MNSNLSTVEDAVMNLLSVLDQNVVERAIIEEKVRQISSIQGIVSEAEINTIIRRIEERFDIRMTLGTMFVTEDYRPWLSGARGDIEWYYWERYKRFLNNKKFPPLVIRSMDHITDQILDHIENPFKEGKWARKGLVVGHVQSGKTANYIGIMNKAADSGYRVIIVLAGMINSLRNQTQERVDSGFIGRCSEEKHDIGVGLIMRNKRPAFFTTKSKDFSRTIANQIGVEINNLREPVVLVVKKNSNTLKNLIEWLQHNNPHNLKDNPMLLIDDEADHASINTKKDPDEVTTINRRIRELIRLFARSSYLGYTATPFANVFIEPETDSDMLGDDLFPRDFIISLDPPDNYIGPGNIFTDERDLDIVREVNDHIDIFPLKHKKELSPGELPVSLQDAVICFILGRTLRILRGQKKEHNSMMVNVSRFTAVQTKVKYLVDEYLKEIIQSVSNYCMLLEEEALRNTVMSRMKKVWAKEFAGRGNSWGEVQVTLKEAASAISVIEVNSSSSAEPLDYSADNYPDGRNVIAVGGLSLSRGLTLEGLITTYFLRNSIMYDTLMQMGRWFGYRDRYEDLCRIYMTPDAFSWYAHISEVTEELRNEFRRMKAAGMTPKQFGLCVRSHPESLIVTARNKMRTGRKVTRKISLEGRLVETSVLISSKVALEANRKVMDTLIKNMGQEVLLERPSGYLWRGIPSELIRGFVNNFCNHPASQLTEAGPLVHYIEYLKKNGSGKWDVVLISPSKNEVSHYVGGLEVKMQGRKITYLPDRKGVRINKSRVGDAQQESAGIPDEILKQAELEYKTKNSNKKNIPGSVYRSLRHKNNYNPLLILHVLGCREEEELISSEGISAYGISFPGELGYVSQEGLVEYVVNTTWWNNEYKDIIEDDEADDE